jgi:hypothetical protein
MIRSVWFGAGVGAIVTAMTFGFVTGAAAQGVFKCTADGKTVYQSTPCAAQGGKSVAIQSGPSRERTQEAQRRAEAERFRAASGQTQSQANAPAEPFVKGGPVDCAKLNKDREYAYGRRNATVRNSRMDNVDNSAQVDRYQSDIQHIESQMARAGCKPT